MLMLLFQPPNTISKSEPKMLRPRLGQARNLLFASFPSVAGEKKGFMYMNKGALLWSIVAHRNMHQLDRQSLLLMITLRL
jgi:hypothetical protein